MEFDLDQRTVTLAIGEFAVFQLGPRDPSENTGNQGVWRAQLGSRWHRELRDAASSAQPETLFEVPISGQVFHGGWTFTLSGRIDQFLPATAKTPAVLREIKTILAPLPAPDEDLRAAHPDYFAQLATYLALRRIADPSEKLRGELVFVEAGSGLSQTIAFTPADELPFRVQLERVAEFLTLRLRARDRLRALSFHSPFAELRAGQETTRADLASALDARRRVLFTAPTGFGKTGVLLECALAALQAGKYSRLLYLTSKATGQLQILRTLETMTSPKKCHQSGDTPSEPFANKIPVAAWHVRPKHEHCLSPTCYCQKREFNHPESVAHRWKKAGLSRFYLLENSPRDLAALRDAGRHAQICPYEITRVSLAFQDVWIGDYNYVFAPANRTLFYNQPGFKPAETLLVIDEAHNLPARAADARSFAVLSDDARLVLSALDHARAPSALLRAWENYSLLLASLPVCDALGLDQEDDLADTLRRLAEHLALTPLDLDEFDASVREQLWRIPALADWFSQPFPKLLWSPREGELRLTCLDAAQPLGEILGEYAGVIFATATPGPADVFAQACGLADTPPASVVAHTPWRDHAYDIAYDTRVDTTYQQRARHASVTADTIAALHSASSSLAPLASRLLPAATPCVAVFFPSYAYAESIRDQLSQRHPHLRVALQPRSADLAAQTAWVDESLAFTDALFLVLGSSFAEGIDTLGGRVSHAMVVGPALPEVNAVQRARVDALRDHSREAAFRRVYQIPGIQKVNQALGRLVRAPGQRAKVVLHCRRFAEPAYASLLDRDYQFGATLATDAHLAAWLAAPQT